MHAPSPDFAPAAAKPPRYRWGLHRFACFCAGSILFLICLGGLVTSHEAGMSVPDWPTSYGYNMFYFPWQDWVGGILFEHSHRLVASGVGVLMTLLAIAVCFQERVWLRWMGLAVPIYVLLEGILGGLRVRRAEDWIGIFHACLAQLLFISVSLIALFTSRWWISTGRGVVPRQWTRRTFAITVLIFAQLVIGATMRHEHAGLSIDDFPLAYGQVWPKVGPSSMAAYNRSRVARNEMPTTPLYILMQMAHRVGAVLITACILAATAAVWLTSGSATILRRGSAFWLGLVCLQFLLGAFTIWTNKAADVATTHVACGALTLMTGALLTAISWRLQTAGRNA
jgi:cytochrome c oxidase assembly protein subunit 15